MKCIVVSARFVVVLTIFSTLALLPVKHASAESHPTVSQPVLVELFTSEGCSSCPPADRLLMELDRKQPVPAVTIIVLSEHVDYWNSLGWRDPYSSHQWSERQDGYASRFGLDSVYTPQMVIDGARQATGSDGPAVRDAIERSAKQPKITLAITAVERTGNGLRVAFQAGAAPITAPGAVLYAAIADDTDRSSVPRGENAGRTLDHIAVVRVLTRIGAIQAAPLEQTVEISLPAGRSTQPLRLILFGQEVRSGHIVALAERGL